MDINFPLVLVILVFLTGVVWALDQFVLKPARGDGPTPTWVEYSGSFFPVLLIVLVLRSFLVEPFQIPSASMVPTLQVGDFILVNKYTYGLRLPVLRTKVLSVNSPKRGEVMVFIKPGDDRYFIKRVIGLPGDEVRVINNVLYINGEKISQVVEGNNSTDAAPHFQLAGEMVGGIVHKIRKRVPPGRFGRNFSVVVPEGNYFMMGDNRDNSSDSRDWGTVPESHVVGRAFAIWMHWESLTSLPKFNRVGTIR